MPRFVVTAEPFAPHEISQHVLQKFDWLARPSRERPGAPREAFPTDFSRPKSPEEPPEERFSSILGRFWEVFRGFSRRLARRSHERADPAKTSHFAC